MKILHVITSLGDGGAEAVLFRLSKELSSDIHVVVSLAGIGKYGSMLREIGIEVHDLGMTSYLNRWTALIRLIFFIKFIEPNVVQTWMYHADFIGGLAARLAGVKNVIWGIHNCDVSLSANTIRTFLLIHLNALLSWVIPKLIISCSQSALMVHGQSGFCKKKLVFVPNGYPIDEFFPSAIKRARMRIKFNISDSEILLGMVARFDPQKDHLNLLMALSILQYNQAFKCILVGKGVDTSLILSRKVKELGLADRVLLVGQHSNIADVMNAIDIFCLSSHSEAFPNVLCEAMACGKPCVATDVGDSAFIIGNTGWISRPGSPECLAGSIGSAIRSYPDVERAKAARKRIVDNFNVTKMARLYRETWSVET